MPMPSPDGVGIVNRNLFVLSAPWSTPLIVPEYVVSTPLSVT
jgi:hypothetical protein